MKKDYIYPAIFTYEEDGITVEFPDLPGCITCGEDDVEALNMAREAMEGYLMVLKDQEKDVPFPTRAKDIKIGENQIVTLVEAHILQKIKENYHYAVLPNSLVRESKGKSIYNSMSNNKESKIHTASKNHP